jgi:hypothetical protein
MGLTIYYKLSVEKELTVAGVRELAARVARYAQKIGCAETGPVERVTADTPFTSLCVRTGREEDCCFGLVPAKRGWVVEVWPGEGCESATMGLCQYLRRIPFRAGSVSTGFAGGWLLKGACKTQYAAEHGWEHFLLCHQRVVSVLEFWGELGVTVEVSDEGGYWQTRDEQKLRSVLTAYDGLMAAVAGQVKDAADDSGEGQAIASPIFARKDFERLEAAGRWELARHLP